MAKPQDQEKSAVEKSLYTHSSQKEGAYHAMGDHVGRHQIWSGDKRVKGENVGNSLYCGFLGKELGRHGK